MSHKSQFIYMEMVSCLTPTEVACGLKLKMKASSW